jgi:tRNA A37 threonylcarbamoyladenosine dehydratase
MNLPQPGDYIDIHAHGGNLGEGVFIIENLMAHEERTPENDPEQACTFGIHPWYLKDEKTTEILDLGFDYVVDAIDTLSPKIFLIYHSLQKKYPVVSSMGAGGKFDPTRINISDISETTDCSLARILRKRLHRLGIRDGFTAVYSPEVTDKNKVVATNGEQNKASIVGTISYMPAAFGIACASVVIRDLAGIPR